MQVEATEFIITDFDPFSMTDEEMDVIHDDIEGRKKKRMAKCGHPVGRFNKLEGHYKWFISECKIRECPRCTAKKHQQEKSRLERMAKKRTYKYVVAENEEQEEAMKKQLGDNWQRVPSDEDGKTYFYFEDANNEIEIGEAVTGDNYEALAEKTAVAPEGKRKSRGKQFIDCLPVVENEEQGEEPEQEDAWEDFEPETEVVSRDVMLDFSACTEDAPKDGKELTAIIQKEYPLDFHPDSAEQLQYAIAIYEQTLESVCQRYGIKFNFYRENKEFIKDSEIDWKWLRLKLRLPAKQ